MRKLHLRFRNTRRAEVIEQGPVRVVAQPVQQAANQLAWQTPGLEPIEGEKTEKKALQDSRAAYSTRDGKQWVTETHDLQQG